MLWCESPELCLLFYSCFSPCNLCHFPVLFLAALRLLECNAGRLSELPHVMISAVRMFLVVSQRFIDLNSYVITVLCQSKYPLTAAQSLRRRQQLNNQWWSKGPAICLRRIYWLVLSRDAGMHRHKCFLLPYFRDCMAYRVKRHSPSYRCYLYICVPTVRGIGRKHGKTYATLKKYGSMHAH